MIKDNDLQKGLTVTYIPKHACGSESHPDREIGVVSSWNDDYVFVKYNTGVKATKREDLRKGNQTFHCSDEHNSVLHGAFGRCESECMYCRSLRELMTWPSKTIKD